MIRAMYRSMFRKNPCLSTKRNGPSTAQGFSRSRTKTRFTTPVFSSIHGGRDGFLIEKGVLGCATPVKWPVQRGREGFSQGQAMLLSGRAPLRQAFRFAHPSHWMSVRQTNKFVFRSPSSGPLPLNEAEGGYGPAVEEPCRKGTKSNHSASRR